MTGNVRNLAITLGLMLVYLAGSAALAVTVDRRFFFNDVAATAVWLLMGIVFVAGGAMATQRS